MAQTPTRALNWQTVVSAASLLLVILASTWTIFQTQFAYTTKDAEQIRQDLLRRETEIKERIDVIQRQLDSRREVFVDQNQHKEFEKRLDERFAIIEKMVARIEQTRPTAGELNASNKFIEQAITKLTADAITRTEVSQLITAHDSKDRLDVAGVRREIDGALAGVNRDIARLGERQDKFTQALDQMYSQIVQHLRETAPIIVQPPRNNPQQ